MPVDKFGRSSRDHYRTDSEVSRLKTYLNNTFLRTDGSKSASGTLNMDTNKISNVVDPLNDQDAATKHYVDAQKNIALSCTISKKKFYLIIVYIPYFFRM